MKGLPHDDFRSRVLCVAGDNDGLWEFLQVIDPDLHEARLAYDRLRPVMSDLLREGLLVIKGEDDVELSTVDAIAVLAERTSWVFPWERAREYPESGQLFGVSLTPLGRRVLASAS